VGLEQIKTSLQTAEGRALHMQMSLDAWASDQTMRGDKVALFRQYADGDHRANLSKEMQRMLRINTSSSMNRFNDNYCDKVIQTEVNRLRVSGFESEGEGGPNDLLADWVADVLDANRFDGLQNEVHEAALRDADTAVMVSWDNDKQRVVLTHEPAWDGSQGMLFVHGPDNSVQAALKVWQESRESLGDTTRVNVYYADRIEKYVSRGGGSLGRYEVEGEPWPAMLPAINGEPLGVTVVHFPNRAAGFTPYGRSEIENAVPLQDALNRTLTSLVMASELTAFQLKVAIGFDPPADVAPGSWIVVGKGGVSPDQRVDAFVLESGQVVPYIQAADWLVGQIGKITDTPLPEFMGGDVTSGEALKQREVNLIGKVQRFQTTIGNRWEDVLVLAHRLQTAFGSKKPPAFTQFSCSWDSPELRNDTEIVNNAKILFDMGFEREALRQMATVFQWDEAKIDQMMEERAAGQVNALAQLPAFPTFNAATFGLPAV
jgi:hypothetical protein